MAPQAREELRAAQAGAALSACILLRRETECMHCTLINILCWRAQAHGE